MGDGLLEAAKEAGRGWESELERFLPGESDLGGICDGSWLLRLDFTLAKPFTSKTENEFHQFEEILVRREPNYFEVQNPVVRDHTTGWPVVGSMTWKGHMRYAAEMVSGVDDQVVLRLFGSSRADEGQAGRLHFFPTFFTGKTAINVITPLYRDTRTPSDRAPIRVEVVPAGSQGTLCLLYVPWPKGGNWQPVQIAQDLQLAMRAVKTMLLEYGFSAKKTAGWGVVQDGVTKGSLVLEGWPELEDTNGVSPQHFEAPQENFWKYMNEQGNVKNEYLQNGQLLSKTQYKKRKEGDTANFESFKAWYQKFGSGWTARCAPEADSIVTVANKLRTHEVRRVSDLVGLADQLANTTAFGEEASHA